MRGLSSFVAGIALLALAFWAFSRSGMSTASMTFAATALFFFFRGSQGREVTAAGDPTAPMDFITNPAGAIVDAAVDQFRDLRTEKEEAKRAEPKPSTALDEAIARHLEKQRTLDTPAAAAAAPDRPVFGRKVV